MQMNRLYIETIKLSLQLYSFMWIETLHLRYTISHRSLSLLLVYHSNVFV